MHCNFLWMTSAQGKVCPWYSGNQKKRRTAPCFLGVLKFQGFLCPGISWDFGDKMKSSDENRIFNLHMAQFDVNCRSCKKEKHIQTTGTEHAPLIHCFYFIHNAWCFSWFRGATLRLLLIHTDTQWFAMIPRRLYSTNLRGFISPYLTMTDLCPWWRQRRLQRGLYLIDLIGFMGYWRLDAAGKSQVMPNKAQIRWICVWHRSGLLWRKVEAKHKMRHSKHVKLETYLVPSGNFIEIHWNPLQMEVSMCFNSF